jgi:hypothetical protein
MARHRYTLREMTDKLTESDFAILKRTYLYFSVFPAVLMARWFGKGLLRFSKPQIHSDLKQTPALLNRFLALLHFGEGRLLRTISFPFGSSLLVLGKKN